MKTDDLLKKVREASEPKEWFIQTGANRLTIRMDDKHPSFPDPIVIADVNTGMGPASDATAELIVRACQSFEAMREALIEASALMPLGTTKRADWFGKATRALKLAEGKSEVAK